MRVTILGSGASSGTPSIGNNWGRCNPANPRNRRMRPAIVVETEQTRILVDTPPDLRHQLLATEIMRLDAVCYTHAHADHLHGIDDLRAINRLTKAALPLYATAHTVGEIRRRFGYTLEPQPADAHWFSRPVLVPHEISAGEAFTIGDIRVEAFEQHHGRTMTLGFRFNDVAYSTDVAELPEASFAVLAGVRLWILGVFSERPFPTHCHLSQGLEWIARVQPEAAVLTHLSSELDYDALVRRLPPHIAPAYDGMTIDVVDAVSGAQRDETMAAEPARRRA
ncbi:MAG: MBL fold metallo-hydrolase [Defluviicoccus sp.]|nr:MBL fold metallo-hydrolase [Defluviicoccus sp.]MDG4591322.1 MBL fold metallo-hydrolase [Defluviicoccus sp.]MDS4011134.1 MBL fold metallo-hydrolase [Defluviicoccus sp.]MDS4072850.1 MBL fold metallo-hydrolase [Defluviicoccus sp.]